MKTLYLLIQLIELMKLIRIDFLTTPLDVEYEVNEDLSTIELKENLSIVVSNKFETEECEQDAHYVNNKVGRFCLIFIFINYIIELERFSSEKEPDDSVRVTAQKLISKNEQEKKKPTLYDKFMESGLIGFCSFKENLSTTYKQVLSDSLKSKYNQEIVTIEEKLKDYPDWDREEQIKRNQKALKKLQERHQKTLQIDDQEADKRQEEFERFKQLMDQFRPQGSKLYSED